MSAFLYEPDCQPELIRSQTTAIIGYGSQGRTHALNLRDSGVSVVVGTREGSPSIDQAQADGFDTLSTGEAVRQAQVISVLTPDVPMATIFAREIEPHLSDEKSLVFAHGFGLVFGGIKPPPGIDTVIVSPKGPGPGIRAEFEAGRGLPALYAVAQDATGQARELALSYAWGIGCARAGILETNPREETITDLFGEQAVLCGGIPALIRAGFETLVAAGYRPEVAYFECLHETRLIVELLYQGGISYMDKMISETAEWGGYLAGPRMVTEETRKEMRAILSEIESGEFANRWIEENRQGQPEMAEYRREISSAQVEQVGREVRRAIPVIDDKE